MAGVEAAAFENSSWRFSAPIPSRSSFLNRAVSTSWDGVALVFTSTSSPFITTLVLIVSILLKLDSSEDQPGILEESESSLLAAAPSLRKSAIVSIHWKIATKPPGSCFFDATLAIETGRSWTSTAVQTDFLNVERLNWSTEIVMVLSQQALLRDTWAHNLKRG